MKRMLLCLALTFCILSSAPPFHLFAQESAQVVNKDVAKKSDGPETLIQMIEESGWSGIGFMVVLGLFSLAAMTIILERLFNLTHNKVIPPAFAHDLETVSRKGSADLDELRALCETDGSPRYDAAFPKVFRSSLLRAGRPVPEVEKAMEDALAREVSTLRGRIRPLNIIGAVAPLVGLLGTVVGMIMAFRTASLHGLGGKAEVLAEGIYLALLTTAAGLIIAIPALLFAAYFNNLIDMFMREMDERLMTSIPCFARMENKAAGEPALALQE